MSFDMKHDPITGGARPYMPPEEKQRIQQISKEMTEDLNDPDFHVDTMGDSVNDESIDKPKNERERMLYSRISKQKDIDDLKI